ncbi:hypothetical protein L596_009276 [Steinernema carpocapsae]|uniref:Uncharacterized protein n=1 Tax=Steinernema carpocapsae TaxID=34508 RepID=A0A4U5PEV8_STECR|nr:hypothetical protein L596_009276 [Steinernema carpocapsae]
MGRLNFLRTEVGIRTPKLELSRHGHVNLPGGRLLSGRFSRFRHAILGTLHLALTGKTHIFRNQRFEIYLLTNFQLDLRMTLREVPLLGLNIFIMVFWKRRRRAIQRHPLDRQA